MSINKSVRPAHARSIAVIFIAALSGVCEAQPRGGATGRRVDLVEERPELRNAHGAPASHTGVTQHKSALGRLCPETRDDGRCVGLEQLRFQRPDSLRAPWRVLAGDRDGDGDNELIASFGGDFGAQRILGFHGNMASRGFVVGVHWASREVGFWSRVHMVDLHGYAGIEVLASTYHGALNEPNSGAHGSGIMVYRAPESPPDRTPIQKPWSVPGETLISCAQIIDFQLADFDLDGDLDIVVAAIEVNVLCEDRIAETLILPDFRSLDPRITPEQMMELNGVSVESLTSEMLKSIDPKRLSLEAVEDPSASKNHPQGAIDHLNLNYYISSFAPASHAAIVAGPPVSSHSSPGLIEAKRPVIAYYENKGNANVPRFDQWPTWHIYTILKGENKPSRVEVFDVNQDGHLDIVVGVEESATVVLLGDSGGQRRTGGETLAMLDERSDRVLLLDSGDDLTTMDMRIAALPMKDGTTGVFIAEARSCHKSYGRSCNAPAHALIRRIGAPDDKIEFPDKNHLVLSVELTEGPQGEQLLLVGRGVMAEENRMKGLPVDAFYVETGDPAPYTLLDSSYAALDLAVLPEYADGVAHTVKYVLKGGAITLPGIGPMRIVAVKSSAVAIDVCGATPPGPCYWRVGGTTLQVRGVQQGAEVSVEYKIPSRRDIAVADVRQGQAPIVAWDNRRLK